MRDTKELWQHASRFQSLLVLILMIVAMSLLSDRFLTPANGWNIMRQISVNVCLSIGMTMVILSGGIDLSVGSVLALSGAITAGLIKSRDSTAVARRRTAIHDMGSDCCRTHRGHVSRLFQRADDHTPENTTLRRHAGHAQYRSRSDHALDQRLSDHRPG